MAAATADALAREPSVDARDGYSFYEVEPPPSPTLACATEFFVPPAMPPPMESIAVETATSSIAADSAVAKQAEEHKEGFLTKALHGLEHLLHLDHHEDVAKTNGEAEHGENGVLGGGAVGSDSAPNAGANLSIGSYETETELRALVLRTEARAERRERENDEALQHFAERLRGLSSEVHAVERRQVKLDQHITELDACVQGVAESIDGTRVDSLEQSQKKLMIMARRSLEMVVDLHNRQRNWEFEQEGKLSFYLKPPAPGTERGLSELTPGASSKAVRDTYKSTQWNAVLDLQWANRLTEQEEKLSLLTSEVAALSASLGYQAANATRGLSLASEPVARKSRSLSPTGPTSQRMSGGSCESWDMVALQSLEAWMENGLKEANRRVDVLQEQVDERVFIPLWQVSQDMPEILSRVDRLTAQCQGQAANIGKHEVRLNLVSERLETCGVPTGSEQAGGSSQATVVGDAGQLAGRVDAHSMALTEIREQLKVHSEALGTSVVFSVREDMSPSSSRGSLAARQLHGR